MSIYKCKMCGGTLEVRENESVCVCDFCGTQQTIATTQDEALQGLFNRANILRMKSEFDKAESLYEKIIQTKSDEAEAYWGLILCRYGIEYVEDPKTFKRIPTCHRTSFDSVIADADYKAALQYADLAQRAIYEAEAKEIDRLQKEILALSQKEDPYDVFICYKETDESGRRTPDSVIANDIYHQLTQEGFKVFYAAISLENKLGSAYEPCIFAALNSAKVMLVVGTKPEYFNAVWVKNEWSRYLKLMKTDRSRILIPCYRDMDAYELPEEFAHLQAQDMSKIGFINDVVRGIKKVLRKDTPAAQPAAAPVSANAAAAQPLIDRGYMALEDKEWAKADEFFEQALNLDAKNGDAYLGKFLVSVKTNSFEGFLKGRASKSYISSHISKPKKEAFRLKDGALQAMVNDYVVPGYLDEKDLINELSAFDKTYASDAGQMEQYIAECRSDWANDKNLLRAKQYGKPEISTLLDAFFSQLEQEFATAKQADSMIVAEKRKAYEQFVREFQITAAQQSAEAKKQADANAAEQERLAAVKERERNEKYQAAATLAAKADSVDAYNKAIKAFDEIRTYRDSDERINTLKERRDRVAAQEEKERARKAKKAALITITSIVAVVVLAVLTVTLFIPMAKYNAADKLYKQSQYEEAWAAFHAIDFKDSNERTDAAFAELKNSYHDKAAQFLDSGDKVNAAIWFRKAGDIDLADSVYNISSLVYTGQYISAGIMTDGSLKYQTNYEYEWKNAQDELKGIVAFLQNTGEVLGVDSAGRLLTHSISISGFADFNVSDEMNIGSYRNIVSVKTGYSNGDYIVMLLSDGTVAEVHASGGHPYPDVSTWKNIIKIQSGSDSIFGIDKDGKIFQSIRAGA